MDDDARGYNLNWLIILPIIFCLSIFISCSTGSKTEYNLKITAVPIDAGKVNPGGGLYEDGSNVEIEATANYGWEFARWSGDYSSSENPTFIEVNNDMQIDAIFRKREYSLNAGVNGQGIVEERIIEPKNKDYEYQTYVELTAVPLGKWEFVHWEGDLNTFSNPDTVIIDSTKDITANFGSYNVPPNDNLESEFYATAYGNNEVAAAKLELTNRISISITLKRISVKNHNHDIIIDKKVSETLKTNTTLTAEFFLSGSETYDQFGLHKVYWEYQLNEGVFIKIGDATQPN